MFQTNTTNVQSTSLESSKPAESTCLGPAGRLFAGELGAFRLEGTGKSDRKNKDHL